MRSILRTLVPVLRTLVLLALILGTVTWVSSTRPAAQYAPPTHPVAGRAAGTTVIVVFIPVSQTLGFFHHAFILFFKPNNLHTPGGAYKTEGLGGGARNRVGLPSVIAPSAPHAVTAAAELTTATNQDCDLPDYLFPPWAACSWQNFSTILQTNSSVAQLLARFAQTARCFTTHPVRYDPWGPNTNTYAYTALRNAGMAHPGAAPNAVAAPGWDTEIKSPCTLH